MRWFTWTDNQGGRANIEAVDRFQIQSSGGFYSVTAYFRGGATADIASGFTSHADALAYIDSIITDSVLEGS